MRRGASPTLAAATVLALATTVTFAAPPASAPDCHQITVFIDGFLGALPPDLRVPRGAFALSDGRGVTCTFGFGVTVAGDRVDPARSIFRAASISKLITATAVMQLVEAGRWSLSDDVNRFLPQAARLQDGFGGPVTLEHLLTHTSGFEDKFEGGITTPDRRLTLADYFVRYRPNRAIPPGAAISYSNSGMALAGYLVEATMNERFAAYAQRAIFQPLGMDRTTFEQPLPGGWLRDVAAGAPAKARRIVFNPYPAASLSTTAEDMGRFIAAHIHDVAASGPPRLLSAGLERAMQSSHWRAQPSVPGVALGFFEGVENGRRSLFHTGDSGDHSLVLILPEEGVGLFLVYSGEDGQSAVRERFTREFLDRFFPAPAGAVPRESPHPSPASELAMLSGTYRNTQYSRSNFEKLKALFVQVRVRVAGVGALEVTPPGTASPLVLKETDRLVFQATSGEVVAFRVRDGRVAGFTLSGSIWDPSSWDRISLWQDGRLHLLLFASVVVVFAARLLAWPAVSGIGRLRGLQREPFTAPERRWWRCSALVSMWMLLAPLVGLGTAFLSFQHPATAAPRAAAVMGAWLALGLLAGLPFGPVAVLSWRRRMWSVTRRVQFSATAAACWLAVPLLMYWKVVRLPW
ncbi:MAG: serine hydrolase domain-containing protein [Vicinamibacterales bacterium]